MENTPKTLLKVYLALQTFTGLPFKCVLFQFNSKKNVDCGEFTIAYTNEIFCGENVKIRHSISL